MIWHCAKLKKNSDAVASTYKDAHDAVMSLPYVNESIYFFLTKNKHRHKAVTLAPQFRQLKPMRMGERKIGGKSLHVQDLQQLNQSLIQVGINHGKFTMLFVCVFMFICIFMFICMVFSFMFLCIFVYFMYGPFWCPKTIKGPS